MVKTANRIHRRLMMEELEPRISPAWLEMGLNSATLAGIGSASNPGLYGGPALAELPDGNPIAVWTSSGTNTEIYAKHWDGSAWQEYTWAGGSSATGGGISNTPSTSQSPAVAVGTDGNPIVAWADYSGTNFEIYVRRWNGASWAEFSPGSASGTGISGTTTSGAWPAITIGSDGNPIVSWHEYVSSKYQLYVKGWNGSSWVPMGAGSASGNGISGSTKGIAQSTPSSLVVGTNGVPIVAWGDFNGTQGEIYVRQWNGSSWVEMGAGSASGGGISNNAGTSGAPKMAIVGGNPMIAWSDTSAPGGVAQIYTRYWNGASWVEILAGTQGSASGLGISYLGSTTGASTSTPTIVQGTDGNPIIAWSVNPPGVGNIEVYARRWDGASWIPVGGFSDMGGGISGNTTSSTLPAMIVGGDGNPVVAWVNALGSTYPIYVRKGDLSIPEARGTLTNILPGTTYEGAATYGFNVAYYDYGAISYASLDNADVQVTGPNGYSQMATLVSATPASNGSVITAIYAAPGPGGTWNGADNGTYTVVLQNNQVSNTSGTFVGGGTLGAFSVLLDAAPPAAAIGSAPSIAVEGGATYGFSVTYSDDMALNVATLDNSDIRVTGPNGFNQLATFVSVSPTGNGTPRTANYRITAPNGIWNKLADGTYTISVEPNQVGDTFGNFVAGGALGTFTVSAQWTEVGRGSASGQGISGNPGDVGVPVIAIGTDGHPVIAWQDNSAGNAEIYVRRWNGASWEALGGSATGGGISNNSGSSTVPTIALDPTGNPIVAWQDTTYTAGTYEIYVRRWDGSSWVELGTGSATGGGISNNATYSANPSVVIGTDGNPIVTWCNTGGVSASYDIWVKRWDGSSWVEFSPGSATVGGISNNSSNSTVPKIILGTDGNPIVAWKDGIYAYARHWDGASWVEYMTGTQGSASGTGLNAGVSVNNPVVGLAADGNPIVAWYGVISGYNQIYARHWNGTSWEELGGSGSGGGISNANVNSYYPSIASGSDGNPIIAWHDSTDTEVYLRRWDGSSWVEMPAGSASGSSGGGGISATTTSSWSPGIAVGPDGLPVVTWNETVGVGRIYVRRYGELDASAPGAALTPFQITSGLGGTTASTFNVTYSDNIAVNVATLDSSDVRVTGPNGFNQLATFVSVDNPTNGLTRTATYRITAPGGAWDYSDNGAYTITMEPNQVSDTNVPPNYAAGVVGTFGAGLFGGVWEELRFSASGGGISANTGASQYPSAVTGTDGNPIVAWQDTTPGNSEIYVSRWTGASWQLMAGASTNGSISGNTGSSTAPAISLGADGNPVVTWQDTTPGNSEIYASRWTGSSWALMPGASTNGSISGNTGSSTAPAISGGVGSNPVVTWQDTSAGNTEVFVSRWTGASWELMASASTNGSISGNTGTSSAPAIVLGAGGNPIVTWQDTTAGNTEIFVQQWTGASWAALAGAHTNGSISGNTGTSVSPAIVLGTDGNPIVAWQDSQGGNNEIYASRWTGASWQALAGTFTNGSVSGNTGSSTVPAITLGAEGNPIVAWQDSGGLGSNYDTYVRRWTGASWIEIPTGSASGGGISGTTSASSNPAIVTGAGGIPIAFWDELAGGNYEIYARRYYSDSIAPTAATALSNVNLPGATTYGFAVTYGDNIGVKLSTLDSSDLLVTGPNAFSQLATFVSVDVNTDGSPRVATYRFTAPGGAWDWADNGTYTITMQPNQVSDLATLPPNYVAAGTLGSLVVSILNPTASLTSAPDVTAGFSPSETITVTYAGPAALRYSTLDNNDVLITGPNGYMQLAAFISGTPSTDGTPITATYSVSAPTVGGWQTVDNGTYTITMQGAQVGDTATPAHYVVPGTLGTFLVNVDTIAPMALVTSAPTVTTGFSTSETITVAYSDNIAVQYASLDGNDVLITGPNGFSQLAAFVSATPATNGTPMMATYSVNAPTGGWQTADNGTYAIAMQAGQVNDTATPPNFVASGYIGGFNVNVDTIAPTGTLTSAPDVNVKPGMSTAETLTVTYSDNVAVMYSTLDSNDLLITGPNGFSQLATFVSAVPSSNGTPIVATYTVDAPIGGWQTANNGSYAIAVQANQVSDTALATNYAGAGTLGTFLVTVDGIPPTASLTASDLLTGGGTTQAFTVTYADNVALLASTFDNSDVRVTGPYGYSQLASFVSVDTAGNGAPRTVTYSITAPGGSWDTMDNGKYTVTMEPSQVSDLAGNYVAAGPLGSFTVDIGQHILLNSGVWVNFLDGDGTTVMAVLQGPGSGYLTLTNGLATGAPIHQIMLNNTTLSSSFLLSCSGGTVPGTTFDWSQVTKAPTAGGALGLMRGVALSLTPNGWITADGAISNIQLAGIGNGVTMGIPGPVASFSATSLGNGVGLTVGDALSSFNVPTVGNNLRMQVTSTMGDFLSNTVGNDLALSVGGNMSRYYVPGVTGTGGSISVGGALNTFTAYTVGNGLGLNVAGDIGNFTTYSLGAGTGVTAGRNVGNIYSYGNTGNGSAFTVQGWLSSFQGGTLGDNFGLQVTGGSLGTFQASALGARPTISVRDNATLIGVSTMGTGGSFTVGGTLGTFGTSVLSDGSSLNVTGDVNSLSAQTLGNSVSLSAGGKLGVVSSNAIGNNTGITAGTGLGTFSVPSVGNNFRLQVTAGTSGDFTANNIGTGLGVSVGGNMTKVTVFGAIGTGGSVAVGGSLNQFSASTVGDGFGLNVANVLGNFLGGTLGNDFGLQVRGGSLGSFQTSALGARGTMSIGGNAGLISVPSLGTGGSFTVGGTLGTFGTSVLSDGSRLNVTGDLNSFSAATLGNGVSINVGGKLPAVSVNAVGNNTGITAGSGLGSFNSPTVGNNFRLRVTSGTSGDFTANAVGDGLGISVAGDMTRVLVPGRIGTGGSVSVGGSLTTFSAYTIGDGFGLNVGNDLSNFVTNSLGGGSGITAGRNVGNIYSYVNIGNGSTIRAQGWLSNFQGATIGNDFGLQVTGGSLGAFRANVLGARPTISVRDNAGVISVPTIGTGGNVTVGGTLSTFNSSIVGDSLNLNVTGDLSYFNANTVGAGVKVFAGGNITNMYVQKSSLTDATITAGQGIGGIYLYQGGILGTSVITANGTAGIGTVSASGGGLSGTFGAPNGNITQLRANGDVNATIRSSGTLGSLTVSGGTAISPRKLSGLIDVRVVSSIYGLYTAMENLTVRASNSINGIQAQSMNNVILSAGSVGNVILSGDLTGSKILSGYDVGADGLFGTGDDAAFGAGATGNITYLKVGGNMSGSSIAANINPGADLKFGTADDTLLASTLGGAIGSIIITGSLTGSGVPAENYGIVSHGAIGGVWVGGSMLTLPWALGNIVVQPSWR